MEEKRIIPYGLQLVRPADVSSGRNSIGAAGLLIAYSCMAFPDAIGVVAALAKRLSGRIA